MNKKDKKPTKKDKKNDLEQKCGEYLDGWKRSQADYQNLQKETQEWKADFVKYSNSDMIMQILPILDNFKSAFKQIPDSEKDSAWVTGFSYIMKQLEELLKNNGVEEIKTVGEQFNCSEHEAIESIEDENYKDDEIVEEKKPGYTLNKKVVQVAKVVVNNRKTEELKNERTKER
ncbi:nucleotide exchange factor GrpE [Candidatus Falkowbacteria bacterium]|jgi:molecular chaperone GrpE|nr:nucleotide exchange factor GrpE [Candidatus Falkowbacteria bacterium]MBT7007230.1 nucleotide exchange factor GrpE [Candidatus Falkowbacteria bacterium]